MSIQSIILVPIENLSLSVRTYNCLKRAGINTIGQLTEAGDEELMNIRNLGKKSMDEIIDVLRKMESGAMQFGEFNQSTKDDKMQNIKVSDRVIDRVKNSDTKSSDCRVSFYNHNWELVRDLNIDDLGLSKRATNALLHGNIEYASQLVKMDYQELCHLRNMGAKCVGEIIEKLKSISFITYGFNDISTDSIERYADVITRNIKAHCETIDFNHVKYSVKSILLSNENELDLKEDISDEELYLKIQENRFVDLIYGDITIEKLIKNHICEIVSFSKSPLSLFAIKQHLPEELRESQLLNRFIVDLVNEMYIEDMGYGFRRYYPTIKDYIETIYNEKAKIALLARVNGSTLEECGEMINVTRERVRQLCKKYLEKRPRVREDDYKDWFEKYNVQKDEFIRIFDIDSTAYNYLALVYENGDNPIEYIMSDEELSYEIRQNAEKEVYKNYITVGLKRIKCTRLELSRFIMKTYCSDEVTIDEFQRIYVGFLKDYGLYDCGEYLYTRRSLEGNIPLYDFILWKQGKKLRYYSFIEYDMPAFVNTMKLDQFKDAEISAYKLFRDYPELMVEYDIRDEYEIHNLLKKLPEEVLGTDVSFGRMPLLVFGNADRDMQVLNLLLQMAPVSNINLANAYEEEYGVKSETVLANFFKCIDEYFFNGMYNIEYEPLNQEEYYYLKKRLTEDFYFIEDVKRIYSEMFPNGDVKRVNSYNLKCLDFKVNVNYIYSNKYSSSDAYFRGILTGTDIVDTNHFDSRLIYVMTYYAVLQQLRAQLEIIEFSDNKFVNIRRLSAAGIEKGALRDYIDDVLRFIGDDYFTIHYLRNRGFSNKLDDLGFDDWFYGSIIRSDENIQFRKVGGSILFKKSREQISTSDFLVYLIGKLRKIDIFDFIDYIKGTYGLKLDRLRVQEIIKNTDLYYDTVMEKIYIDYDEYYEEV